MSIEAIECQREAEPNDTPATATPYLCGMLGSSDSAPVAHCYLGDRAGNVCTRSAPLPQSFPDSDMRCSISNVPCVLDISTGGDDCAPGGGVCQQHTDLDCDPRCDVGPNAGRACSTTAFCNPVSDQGATCVGTCQIESTCIVTSTGANTGTACTPVCVGSAIPAVNGRYCSALSGCPGGGVCVTSPLVPTPGATCVAGQTCSRMYNEGDVDFFSLGNGVPFPANSTVFVTVDAKSANDHDFRGRVTSDVRTLQFDDDDGTRRSGEDSPVIAGALTRLNEATFIEVSRSTSRTMALSS